VDLDESDREQSQVEPIPAIGCYGELRASVLIDIGLTRSLMREGLISEAIEAEYPS
jgi:hypothetical protein